MKSKFLYQFTDNSLPVGPTMTSLLAQQARVYGLSTLPKNEIARMLFEASDLTCFGLRQLEDQERFEDPDRTERSYQGFHDWGQRKILRLGDAKASEVISDALGLDDLDGLAKLMVALNAHDHEFVGFLLSGQLGGAIRRVPSAGYGEEGTANNFSYGVVMDLIEMVMRLWIADGLQMAAAAAHVRLFRPTECEVLDGPYSGSVPRQGSIAVRTEPDLALYEAAARLHFEELRKPLPESAGGVGTPTHHNVTITTPGANYAFSWPADSLRSFRRDATEAEAAVFRAPGLDLEQRAKLMLVYWRAQHGDQLEAWLEQQMRKARQPMRLLRAEVDNVRKDASRRNQHAHLLLGPHPLIRLWLACERAVAWTGPADHGNRAIDRASTQPLDAAIRASRSGQSIAEPRIAKHNVRRAQELFFALRCTIVRDPGHLPKGLLDVTLETGQTIPASSREEAEQHRGASFGFDEIYGHQLLRMNERNGEEIFSHSYTTPANDFMKQHQRKSTDASRAIVAQAWGAIVWRLKK